MTPQGFSSERQLLEQKYKTARTNLAMMIVLSIVNIILLLIGSNSMLLFSATVPYIASVYAIYGFASTVVEFVVLVAIAAVPILLYMLCWWQSKNHVGWMITALILFILDTAFMVYMYISMLDVSGILDILIHAWVIYYLVIGAISGTKIKKLPAEPVAVLTDNASPAVDDASEQPPLTSSSGLYPAEENVKARIFAQAQAAGHHIVYRRVKRVNELVIDGYVYDRLEALVETAHMLRAVLNGVLIEVGFDGAAHSYIKVDN